MAWQAEQVAGLIFTNDALTRIKSPARGDSDLSRAKAATRGFFSRRQVSEGSRLDIEPVQTEVRQPLAPEVGGSGHGRTKATTIADRPGRPEVEGQIDVANPQAVKVFEIGLDVIKIGGTDDGNDAKRAPERKQFAKRPFHLAGG